ncbi:pyridoxamine 5'-phosphate oxidase family protein [Candidatus Dojkabacteria bacterium]|jgi:uncharacterized protein YhbP (UPF0306 family)|nr:pyridoxamine 5'-phosphate oxidase family protein [Candidatus Dojkabacteria bacterium]
MEEIKEQIYKYLQTQILMSISTFGEYPWPAIVYYVVDKDLNLYFISGPGDQHCKNIKENNKVSCAIYNSSQVNEGSKVGIQYSGEVSEVNDLLQVKWMVKLWLKLISGKNGYKPKAEDLLNAKDARVYKVAPKKIKFYNSRDFKEKFRIYNN